MVTKVLLYAAPPYGPFTHPTSSLMGVERSLHRGQNYRYVQLELKYSKNIADMPQQIYTYLLVWCFSIKHRNSVPYHTEDYFKSLNVFVSQYQNLSVELFTGDFYCCTVHFDDSTTFTHQHMHLYHTLLNH
jgi:hypothetical protein